ncbi:hypothetical protein QF037_009943 [Streptomyces canus]|uniref:hypothetical protein n=1 Tax=Streptomyces canus TaxID=58343 RepID=UPI002783FB28|nr:hypothetical protein [Streptomyces canus]MDQ0605510.1 hypothetical protein [Streptomyces canus]
MWGYRVRPSSELADLTRFGSRRLHIRVTPGSEDDDYAWQFHTAEPDDSTAQAATLIDVEWLAHEDVAVQSECPACTKASRSTSLITGPGRTGWGHYHRCRACDHAWPAAPEYTPGLTKHGRWSFTRADGCFACSCLRDYPCQDGCTIQPDPLIGQRLCTHCRSQHPHDVWQQLAAVAYGTTTVFDHLDDQRDRWLYSEALRGTSPAQAAQAWQHRLALTAQRAAPRHIEPTTP